MEMGDSSNLITVICERHQEVLICGLWRFFQLDHIVDFEISWGGRTIRAHQLVLDVFLAPEKFTSSCKTNRSLDHASSPRRDDCMDHLIEFMYTGKVEGTRDQLNRLMEVAKHLDFQLLVDAIELAVLNYKAQSGLSRVWMYSNKTSTSLSQKTQVLFRLAQKDANETSRILPSASADFYQNAISTTDSNHGYVPVAPSATDSHATVSSLLNTTVGGILHVSAPITKTKTTTDSANTQARTLEESAFKILDFGSMSLRTKNVVEAPLESGDGQLMDGGKPVVAPSKPARRKAPFICDVCGRVFKRSQILDEHYATHTGAKPYKCDECGKSYSQRGSLLVHTRCHTGVRPYACDQCGKTFPQSCQLTVHRLNHTTEKPFRCELCGKTYRRSGSLANHRFTHMDKFKKFKCKFCDEVFKTRRERSLHSLTHSGLSARVCQFCGMQFGHVHLRTHRNIEKPVFQCEICGKSLTSRLGLKFHLRIHTGEKPLECGICGKRFRRDNSLASHTLTHRSTRN